MEITRYVATAAAAALALLTACARPQPTLQADVELRGRDAVVKIAVTNFEFVPRVGGGNKLDGHVHLRLDDGPEMMAFGPEFTFKGVHPGAHSVLVQLADRNHRPIGIERRVPFQVP